MVLIGHEKLSQPSELRWHKPVGAPYGARDPLTAVVALARNVFQFRSRNWVAQSDGQGSFLGTRLLRTKHLITPGGQLGQDTVPGIVVLVCSVTLRRTKQ